MIGDIFKRLFLRAFGLLLLLMLVGILSVQGQSRSEADRIKAAELFNAGTTLMGKGEIQQAIEKFNDAILIDASFPYPYVNRAVALASLSKLPEALSDADKAISLYGDSAYPQSYVAIAYQVKGMVFQNQGKNDVALEAFSKAIEMSPSDPKLYNSRGNLQRILKNFESALKDFDKGIELNPKIPHLFVNRGSVHLNLKHYEASIKDLDEAIRLDSTIAGAFLNRANTHTETKNYAAALSDYNQAISLARKPEHFYGRGRLYIAQGKFDLAVKDNSEALAIDPKSASAYGNRGVAYGKLGKHLLAIEDLRKAVALRPDAAGLRFNLSHQLYTIGQFSEAAVKATEVIEMAPIWRDPYLLRSLIYAKMGNAAKAKTDRDRAAKLGTGNKPFEGELAFTIDIFLSENPDQ